MNLARTQPHHGFEKKVTQDRAIKVKKIAKTKYLIYRVFFFFLEQMVIRSKGGGGFYSLYMLHHSIVFGIRITAAGRLDSTGYTNRSIGKSITGYLKCYYPGEFPLDK